MAFRFSFGVAFLLALVGCVAGQPLTPPVVTATPIVRADGSIAQPTAGEATGRVIDLSRVQIDIPRGTEIGDIRKQPMAVCQGSWGKVLYEDSRFSSRSVEWKDNFDRVLTGHGYRTAGMGGKLFTERNAEQPDYLVGANITNLRVDGEIVCDFVNASIIGMRGVASITVDWQVFDPVSRRIVYQNKQEGRYSSDSMIPYDAALLMQLAFGNAANKLAADPALRDLVQQSRAPVTAIASAAPIAGERWPLRRLPASSQAIDARIDMIRSATILIEVGDGAHGSGFIIAENGLAITNRHVVGGQRFVRVRLVSGRAVIGEVLRQHEGRDVALLKLEGSGYPALSIRETPVRVAEEVYAIGAPQQTRFGWTVTRGVVSAWRPAKLPMQPYDLIQADVAVHPGNSGGPLLDKQGNLVAICVSGFGQDNMSLNQFIPILDGLDKLGLDLVDPAEYERRRRQVAVQ